MYKVHEILIHESQPICNPSGQISWTLANFMAWFMAAQIWPEILLYELSPTKIIE